MRQVKQVRLRASAVVLIAWLDAWGLRPGMEVTLADSDDPARWWTVEWVGGLTRELWERGDYAVMDALAV